MVWYTSSAYIFSVFWLQTPLSRIGPFLRILLGASSCFQGGAIKEPFTAPGYFTDIKEEGRATHIYFRCFKLTAVKRETERGLGWSEGSAQTVKFMDTVRQDITCVALH